MTTQEQEAYKAFILWRTTEQGQHNERMLSGVLAEPHVIEALWTTFFGGWNAKP